MRAFEAASSNTWWAYIPQATVTILSFTLWRSHWHYWLPRL